MCSYKNEAKVSNQDCFAFACNDAKRYKQGKVVILRGEYPEESHEKRSFGFHPQDDIGVLPTCHCDERSEEAIHKNAFKCVQTGTSKRKENVISWIASLPLAMTPFGTFRDDRVLKKKAAFTLAEVLITLGIIGIVASMTLPTLLSNVQDKILESESKKAANIVANGYKLMMAHDEIFRISDIPFWSCNSIECVSSEHKKVFNIVNDGESVLENLKNVKYLNSKKQEIPFSWERDPYYAFITTDGFAYGVLEPDNWDEVNSFDIIADVNANNNPNRVAKDLHKYRFSGEGGQLFDVTDELEQVSECSANNPSGCITPQQCESIADECRALGYDGSAFFDDTGCYCGYDPK